MLVIVTWWFVILWTAECMVLDPALYLAPSPPLMTPTDDTTKQWLQPRTLRDADYDVLPIEQIKTPTEFITTPQQTVILQSTTTPHSTTTTQSTTTTTEQEMMEKSETFYPGVRSTASTGPLLGPYLGIQGIHVPLTFSLTGTYGRYGTGNIGVIGSSYASVDTADSGLFKLYGKSGLAGSSYGSYGGYGGTRIYGSGGGASWGGWGNGKWGHYGKG